MKAALYCRVSTDSQEMSNQLNQLREFCEKSGWQIYEEYTEIIRAGVTKAVLAGTSRTIQLYPGDQLKIYHAGAPTMQIQPM